MKLAEALMLRADLQKKQASLRERIGQYATVQQGEAPPEDPNELLRQANALVGELEQLVYRINLTNLHYQLGDGRSLTQALARRDALAQQHSLLTAAIAGSTKKPDRYGLSEIKWVAVMNVAGLQKQADDVAKLLRETNALIQEANWKAELVE